MINIRVKTSGAVVLPSYETEGSAGADVRAYLSSPVTLRPGERRIIPTGIFLEIPQGFEVQVRPRSGLAAKHGITVLNTPGTIDSDYRGEVKIILINLGDEDFVVSSGDRIAQLVAAPVIQASFVLSDQLSDTKRGEGGFGSTGA